MFVRFFLIYIFLVGKLKVETRFSKGFEKNKLPETNIGNWVDFFCPSSVPAYAYILTDTSSQFKVKGIPYQTSDTCDGS